MPKAKPMRGMGVVADPYRGPVKKRGGKRPARPGWGQALLGRSRRGWSHGGELSPKGYQQGRALTPRAVKKAWGYNRPYDPRNLTAQLASPHQVGNVNAAIQAGKVQHFGPSSGGSVKRPPGGWSVGGALNSKRKGYQSGRTVNPRAAGEKAMKTQRRMQYNRSNTSAPAGWGAYGSPFSSNARFPSPPGGWNRGGPAKFRDDQSLGIRGGKVRKPVGYQGGGALASMKGDIAEFPQHAKFIRGAYKQRRQNILSGKSVRTPAPKRKRISTKKGGGGWNTGGILAPHPAGGKMRIAKPKKHKPQILKRAPSKRSKAKQKYLKKGRGG